MRRLVAAGLAVALLVAVAIGSSALAYFSSVGSGSASAAVTKLNAPTISAATPAAGGTVTLTWGAVTPPAAAAVKYYVTRDGGDAAGTCPVDTAPTTVVTCKDSGVPIGEHTYRVTALWETWTAVGTAKAATVTIGEATKFTISGSTAAPAAGAAVNLTITAKDVANNTVTTYAGSHSLVFSGATSSPGGNAPSVSNSAGTVVSFGAATALTFTTGVATISAAKNGVLRVYKAGTANVVATEGSLTTPTPLALSVSVGEMTKFALTAATATPAAGVADDLTITAQDAYGNTITAYTGSHDLVFSGASASPGGNLPTVSDSTANDVAFGTATPISFNAGVASGSGDSNGEMVIYKSGAASIKATEGAITNTALAVTVAAGTATKLAMSATTLTPVAAANVSLTLTAQDVYGNTIVSYTGAKNLVFSGAAASPSGATPTVANSSGTAISFGATTAITFTNGVATVSSTKNGVLKLNKAGAASVSVTDGTISSVPLAFTVSVGAASRWALTGTAASAGTIGSPCLFTCTITTLGNSGTVVAKVAVTDSVGNTVSELGTGHSAKITTTGGTIAGTPLEIPATGPAVSSAQFTYTAPASGAFSNTITVAFSVGTAYTSATATASK